jgi:glycosyltransferase involved in cell wall biosynthesis
MLLADLSEEMGFELKNFYRTGRDAGKRSRGDTSKSGHWYSFGLSEKFAIWMIRSAPGRELLKILGINNLKFERRLKREKVDLVYFASPNASAMGLTEIPFITTVWDLGHRDIPQYPEISSHGRWELREEFYRATIPKSLYVITDSKTTGEKLQSIYGLAPNKWLALGLLPRKPDAHALQDFPIDTSSSKYVYYPANKWAHKNHRVVFEAMRLLKARGEKVTLVLTGTDKGFGEALTGMIKDFDIRDVVVDLGFRSNEEVAWLMTNSASVVMPSLLGPTNLPPLEAGLLGVPAIVSDAHFFDGDETAIITVVKALDPESWADAIEVALYKTAKGLAVDETRNRNESRRKLKDVLETCVGTL